MVAAELSLAESLLELAARHLDVSVGSLQVTRLTGDASTRSYFRLANNSSSVVVAVYGAPFDETEPAADRLARLEAVSPAARLSFANDPCAHIEVTRLFLEAGLPVPKILKVSGSDRALLIEDVGDTRLQDWLQTCDPTQARRAYEDALGFIVKLQEATERANASESICSRLAFDEAKLRWELDFFSENFFNRYLGLELSPETEAAIQHEFGSICSELAARPRVLVHRDFHARNVMVCGDAMFIIDHQDARMGPASYDVASLLCDPYAALEQCVRRDLLDYFIDAKMKSRMPIEDTAAFVAEYEMMTVQRMLKAIGTYACQAAVMKNSVYLPYIQPAVDAAITSIRSLGRYSSTGALLESAADSV